MEKSELKGKLFSLFKQKGKSPYWYVRYKNPVTGKFDSKGAIVSTKCKTKGEAENWAIAHIDQHIAVETFTDSFESFTNDFFTVNSTWYVNKNKQRPPEKLLTHYDSIFRKYILPYFKNKTLSQIDRYFIREYRTEIAKLKICGGYKSLIMVLLRYILKEAEAQGKIEILPRVEGFTNEPKQKGILSDGEVSKLFASHWSDKRAYTANLLLCYSGMRTGEMLSLRPTDIDFSKNVIHITRSYNSGLKLQNEKTKSGKNRICPIPDFVANAIKDLIDDNPYGTDASYIFYSQYPNEPMAVKYLILKFQEQLKMLGVDFKAKNITLHSYRHRWNSKLINSGINILRIQSIIGHSSNSMSELYHHIDAKDDFADIREIQDQANFTLQ